MAPCAWVLTPAEPECDDWEIYSDAMKVSAAQLATNYMWAATGRRYGACELTVRPCQPAQQGSAYRTYPVQLTRGDGGGIAFPYIDSEGTWRNCGCGSNCCCDARFQMELAGPVQTITGVTIDGVLVPDDSYRVDVRNGIWLLVRLDGQAWPRCQDFDVDIGVGTFEIIYIRGDAIPSAVLSAAEILACEFGKALSGDASCRLPQRIVSITRQGVTVEVEPPEQADLGWVTGIPEVDQVIAIENPSRLNGRPVVYSPDLPTRGDRYTMIPVGS